MRKPIAVSIALLGAMLGVVAVASAGIITPYYVSASVHPRHILHGPYRFTTSGKIHYRRCPHGTTKHNYCTVIPPRRACRGTVSLRVRIDRDPLLADQNTIVARASGKVRRSCRYSITTTIPTSDLTATSRYHPHEPGSYTYLTFFVRFNGKRI